MFKAISFIETLFVLVLISLSLMLFIPQHFQLNDYIALNNEIDQVKSFIYNIQQKARYSNKNGAVLDN
ncbi:hypothetical protein A4G19_05065 [Pasteurellaceae bacterium Macca]|nr:hypothetical protein [Pasteurellaceae bacterium Macca]